MNKIHRAIKPILFLMIFSIISKFLGLIRDMLIASVFGAGRITDIFFFSNTFLILITTLITQAINTTIIPVLIKTKVKHGTGAKDLLMNNIMNIMIILSVIVTILSWIIAPYIAKIVAIGFDYNQLGLMVRMIRIGLPSIILAAIAGVNRGYLQSELKYYEAAISDSTLNIINIIFLVFICGTYGLEMLMVAIIISGFIRIFIQNVGLRKTTYKYKLILNINDKNIRHIAMLTIPVFMNTAISDLNKLIDKAMASILTSGSISALHYAGKLNAIVMGIFIISIVTVIFPMLSNAAIKNDFIQLKGILRHSINSIILVTFPATIGFLVLAEIIVKVLFERGEFDIVATQLTSESLYFYSFALTGMALRLILIKTFYALQDTKTPLINGIISSGLNIILNFILIRYMQHKGLALATSISSVLLSILLIISLTRKIGSINIEKMLKSATKILTASIFMGVIIEFLYRRLPMILDLNSIPDVIYLFGLIILGVIIYGLLIYLLKIDEARWLVDSIIHRRRP